MIRKLLNWAERDCTKLTNEHHRFPPIRPSELPLQRENALFQSREQIVETGNFSGESKRSSNVQNSVWMRSDICDNVCYLLGFSGFEVISKRVKMLLTQSNMNDPAEVRPFSRFYERSNL